MARSTPRRLIELAERGIVGVEPHDTLVGKSNNGHEGQSEGRKCRPGPGGDYSILGGSDLPHLTIH